MLILLIRHWTPNNNPGHWTLCLSLALLCLYSANADTFLKFYTKLHIWELAGHIWELAGHSGNWLGTSGNWLGTPPLTTIAVSGGVTLTLWLLSAHWDGDGDDVGDGDDDNGLFIP